MGFTGCIKAKGLAVPPAYPAQEGRQRIEVLFEPYQLSPEVRETINFSLVEVTPVSTDCLERGSVATRRQSPDDFQLSVQVLNNCDYQFDIYLGTEQSGGKSLLMTDKDVYKNSKKIMLTPTSQRDKALKVTFAKYEPSKKQFTAADSKEEVPAEEAPSSESSSREAGEESSDSHDDPLATGDSTLQRSGGKVAVKFESLFLSDGKGSFTMSDKITGDYILIDFSSSSCSVCQSLARELNASRYEFPGAAARCNVFTLIEKYDFQDWQSFLASYGLTRAAAHSFYGEKDNARVLLQKLGSSSSGRSLPYLMLLHSRSGAIISESAGYGGSSSGIIKEFMNRCQ
jgi:hypothetical protein